MNQLSNLQPTLLWKLFEEVCHVPRPSKKEEKMTEFLLYFAKKHNLEGRRDNAGNVMIRKQATAGMENRCAVVLQSHIDMVCEKNSDVIHDFENDPILPFVDGDWVKAKGTTLGSDDGIGIAAQLAVLISDDIQHGTVECLFTVDEETGLTGASALTEGFFNGNILLNLDSEDEGELFIGCAGGKDTTACINFDRVDVPDHSAAFKINVSGLKGGHSGDDIDKGLGNSNKILTRLLWHASRDLGLRIHSLNGGNLRNALPREAYAIVTIPESLTQELKKYFNSFSADVKNELSITEPGLQLTIESADIPEYVIDNDAAGKLLNALYACPHGVIAMSQSIPGLVETSTNLASVKFTGINRIMITTSQRSSVSSSIDSIAEMVESVFILAGADIEHSEGYPGWTPNTKSEILNITRDSYISLFGNTPNVRAIHAGLECGLFLRKYPKLDMISFGPTIKGAHSPDEKLHIGSVVKFWKLLTDVLMKIPVK